MNFLHASKLDNRRNGLIPRKNLARLDHEETGKQNKLLVRKLNQ